VAGGTDGEVAPEGRPPAETNQIGQLSRTSMAQDNGVSRSTQQKLDALARKRPDLLEKVKAGELSAHRIAPAGPGRAIAGVGGLWDVPLSRASHGVPAACRTITERALDAPFSLGRGLTPCATG
jgi:hypothetical protein